MPASKEMVKKKIAKKKTALLTKRKRSAEVHPWRACPPGKHWVRTFSRIVELSTKNPDGVTTVEGHCRTNPSHKDQMYPDEVHQIVLKFFGGLFGPPAKDDLDFINGNAYDVLIRGWTKYWNEVFQPAEPLDPNFIKALIASESGFNPRSDNKMQGNNRARGLMQVTTQTRKILGDEKGELHDRLLNIDQNELTDPNLNICAGIRWLFRKKEIVESRMGRSATWREILMDYKAYRGKPNAKGMILFDGFYERLTKIEKTNE